MASFITNAGTGVDMRSLWPGVGFTTIASTLATSTTSYSVSLASGLRAVYTGTGFTFSGNTPTGGSYATIELRSADGLTLLGTFTTGAGGALLTSIGSAIDWRGNPALLGGTSTIAGLSGGDYLIGGIGNSTITGAGGHDTIDGGDGVDSIDGGIGNDVVVGGVSTSAAMVIDVNLAGEQGAGAWGSIANVEGLGTAARNFATGSGDDFITTSDMVVMNDHVATFAGNDGVAVARGADHVDMGSGDDDLLVINYAHNSAAISMALSDPALSDITGTASDGEAGLLADSVSFSGVRRFEIHGGSGLDTLRTGAGNDTVFGNDGNDLIHSQGGTDSIHGGAGIDTFVTDLSAALAVNIDLALAQQSSGVLLLQGVERLGIRGSASFITGSGNDVIVTGLTSGFAGLDDQIETRDGADTVSVGRGHDNVQMGTQPAIMDTLVIAYGWTGSAILTSGLTQDGMGNVSGSYGDAGNASRVDFTGVERFSIATGSGADNLLLGDGDDTIASGLNSDTIHGGGGLDVIDPGRGASDSVDGGAGIDTLVVDYTTLGTNISMTGGTSGSIATANALNSITYASMERFQIYASSGADTLRGDARDDVLDGGTGADSMVGGAGDDTYAVDNAADVVVENAAAGTDTVYFRIGGQTLANHVEIARLTGAATSVTGNALDNALVGNETGLSATLNGGAGNDTFWSGPQADTMDGGSGNDVFYTGGGADRATGGSGDDQVVVYHLGVILAELANEGTDTYWVGVAGNFVMDANTEIGRLFGAGTGLVGNSLGNDLVANVTASALSGQAGDDVLWGQGGADTLTGGAGNDIFRTGGGADSCIGGVDNDSYVVLDTGAVVTELAGQGYDIVYMGAAGAFFIGEHIEEARLFGAGNALTGGANGELLVGNNAGLASTIDGRGGADLIYGSTAADTLSGGAGNDTLYGLSGADQFRFTEAGWDFDQIADFSQAEGDKLYLVGSGATDIAQLQIVSGGNTQITFNGDVIYLFGVSSVTAADFIFT